MALSLLFTPLSLAEKVEHMVATEEVSYVEAVCNICDDNGIEPEDIVPILSSSLRDKLEYEAMKVNRLPKRSSLY